MNKKQKNAKMPKVACRPNPHRADEVADENKTHGYRPQEIQIRQLAR
jgi:hypothetical protein